MGGNSEKRQQRQAREANAAMAKELDADMVDDSLARAAAKLATKPAVDNGAEELFEKKCGTRMPEFAADFALLPIYAPALPPVAAGTYAKNFYAFAAC